MKAAALGLVRIRLRAWRGVGKERGDLIKPGEFSAADSGVAPLRLAVGSRADSSVAKYSVKHKDFVSYANKCLKSEASQSVLLKGNPLEDWICNARVLHLI